MFHLTIWVDDLDAFLADPDKTAVADGWVGCPALGGRHPVERGVFNLFVPSDDLKRSNMRYRLWFRDGGGRAVHARGPQGHRGPRRARPVEGHDDAVHDGAARPCRGGSTTRAPRSHARGILYIRPADFATQVTTFRGDTRSVVRFGRLFAATLWRTYRGGLPG